MKTLIKRNEDTWDRPQVTPPPSVSPQWKNFNWKNYCEKGVCEVTTSRRGMTWLPFEGSPTEVRGEKRNTAGMCP